MKTDNEASGCALVIFAFFFGLALVIAAVSLGK